MLKSDGRILTTHTGSLPRDPALTALYADRLSGRAFDADALERLEIRSVADRVAQQIEAGIDVVNNGEQQRESFVLYMRHRLTGLGGEGSRKQFSDLLRYPQFSQQIAGASANKVKVSNQEFLPKAIGEITYTGKRAVDLECATLAKVLKSQEGNFAEAFMTAPSPGLVASIVENEHYDSFESYLAALSEALCMEYEAVVAHGYILQIDCPDLAMERHCMFQNRPIDEFLAFIEAVVGAINSAIRNIPRDRVRLHVCWGNYEGPHDDDVPLAEILPVLLKLNVGGLVMPFGNGRHEYEYASFKDLPLREDQVLVAGVIDTLSNVVEHPNTIANRLTRIAEVLGDPSRLMAGTDCGFDTSAGNGRVAPDVVWAKLKALQQGARRASGQIF